MNIYDIKQPEDIKECSIVQPQDLTQQVRVFLVRSIAKTGGHLPSNLGVVELTLAMHYVFDSPTNKFIFDVGHQSYVHKILTDRGSQFATLRQYKGIAGFQKRKESEHDVWEAGHSSTSLSAALGMAVERDLHKDTYQIVSVIGDGVLSGGMATEALNQVGSEQRNMVIIFSDNNISISQNAGIMDEAFTKLRISKFYTTLKEDLKGALSTSRMGSSLLHTMKSMKNAVKENVVDTSISGDFNLDYIGLVDRHDLKMLIKVPKIARQHEGPIIAHIITKKGKGCRCAEEGKEGKWHGVSQSDPETGESLAKLPAGHKSQSEVMSRTLMKLAKHDERIVVITPAMKSGSKLSAFFDRYPTRSFDCGVTEEHAMTFAAGLCTQDIRSFTSVYSSFLQRAYDQISHDVARVQLPVVIGIDRCSLVGEDGETHHGVFDIAILRPIPNMILAQPRDAREAQNLLYSAFTQNNQPYAVRYPRGSVSYQAVEQYTYIPPGTWTQTVIREDYALNAITYGPDVDCIVSKTRVDQLPIRVINACFFKPIDEEFLASACEEDRPTIVFEPDMLCGGLSSAITESANDHRYATHFIRMGIDDHFVERGSLPQLRKLEHLDMNTLLEIITSYLRPEKKRDQMCI